MSEQSLEQHSPDIPFRSVLYLTEHVKPRPPHYKLHQTSVFPGLPLADLKLVLLEYPMAAVMGDRKPFLSESY